MTLKLLIQLFFQANFSSSFDPLCVNISCTGINGIKAELMPNPNLFRRIYLARVLMAYDEQ